MPFEGSTKAMAQSSSSNITPIHGGGMLPAGAVAPNFRLHVTPDLSTPLPRATLSDARRQPDRRTVRQSFF
jgi:hypothetical protein